jgi:hypothetical protein
VRRQVVRWESCIASTVFSPPVALGTVGLRRMPVSLPPQCATRCLLIRRRVL